MSTQLYIDCPFCKRRTLFDANPCVCTVCRKSMDGEPLAYTFELPPNALANYTPFASCFCERLDPLPIRCAHCWPAMLNWTNLLAACDYDVMKAGHWPIGREVPEPLWFRCTA